MSKGHTIIYPKHRERPLRFDKEPVHSKLTFINKRKENNAMPEMTRSDFGDRIPTNAAEILQFINNAILYHEESVFWNADPADTDQWETDLIRQYLSGDRHGILEGAPEPVYK